MLTMCADNTNDKTERSSNCPFFPEFAQKERSRIERQQRAWIDAPIAPAPASSQFPENERAYCSDMATNISDEIEDVDRKQNTEVANTDEFPPEYLIKHPLQNTWTLWYYEPDRNKSWEERHREVTSFDTAEDFWSLYNHIKTASELRTGCDYSMFKQGIRPMWEDDKNKCGGRWIINLDKKQRAADLDNFWLEILLCMIGEAFNEHSEDICGAVVNVRAKGDKLCVWTSDAESSMSVMEIGRKLKDRLRITSKTMMGYQVHKETMATTGNQIKNAFTL